MWHIPFPCIMTICTIWLTDPFLTQSPFHLLPQTLALHHFVMKEKYFDQIKITIVRLKMSPGIARGLLAQKRQMGELSKLLSGAVWIFFDLFLAFTRQRNPYISGINKYFISIFVVYILFSAKIKFDSFSQILAHSRMQNLLWHSHVRFSRGRKRNLLHVCVCVPWWHALFRIPTYISRYTFNCWRKYARNSSILWFSTVTDQVKILAKLGVFPSTPLMLENKPRLRV